jgi:ankyrin repeat protein
MENRTYLWLHLVLDEIRTSLEFRKPTLERLLKELPTSVANAYERILDRATTEERDGKRIRSPTRVERAKRLLHMIVAAERPMTLREMHAALEVVEKQERGEPCLSGRELDVEDPASLRAFEQKIRNHCGLFVSVIDSRVYLIHQTAKEFLIANGVFNCSHVRGDMWKRSLRPADSNRVLARACMTYLLLLPPNEYRQLTKREELWITSGNPRRTLAFLGYAARYRPTHFRRAKTEARQLLRQALRLCSTQSRQDLLWHKAQGIHPYHDYTDLMVASQCGLTLVVDELLSSNKWEPAWDARGRTALEIAAAAGYEDVVSLLLKNAGPGMETPILKALKVASRNGHKPVVQLLVDQLGVKSYNFTGAFDSLLTKLRLKTQTDGDIVAALKEGLISASSHGHRDVVELLLDSLSARPNGDLHSTLREALNLATSNGRNSVVEFLLNTLEVKIDVDFNVLLHQVLLLALEKGQKAVIGLLLEKAARTYGVEELPKATAAYTAARLGHWEVVKLMVENGLDVNVVGSSESGATLLSMAAQGGYDASVQWLLESGAAVDTQDEDEWTALHYASISRRGRVPIIQLLLDKGADVHSKSRAGETALHVAAKSGNESAVRLLIEKGADLNTECCGNAALGIAIHSRHDASAMLLIQNGADPTILVDSAWRGAPDEAMFQDQVASVARKLERYGVSPDSFSGIQLQQVIEAEEPPLGLRLQRRAASGRSTIQGRTGTGAGVKSKTEHAVRNRLLNLAAWRGDIARVEWLLKTGADAGMRVNNLGHTALHIAVAMAYMGMARLLIEKGADPDQKGLDGVTPWELAARLNRKDLLQILKPCRIG